LQIIEVCPVHLPVPGMQLTQPTPGAQSWGWQSRVVVKPPLPSQTFSTVPSQRMVPAVQGGPASLPPVLPLLDEVVPPPLPLLDDDVVAPPLPLLDDEVTPPVPVAPPWPPLPPAPVVVVVLGPAEHATPTPTARQVRPTAGISARTRANEGLRVGDGCEGIIDGLRGWEAIVHRPDQ
jgi:hypothetical protein